MIPVIGSDRWFLMPLRPTTYSPAKLAKVRVIDGEITHAFARERWPNAPELGDRQLHWATGTGSWTESA